MAGSEHRCSDCHRKGIPIDGSYFIDSAPELICQHCNSRRISPTDTETHFEAYLKDSYGLVKRGIIAAPTFYEPKRGSVQPIQLVQPPVYHPPPIKWLIWHEPINEDKYD